MKDLIDKINNGSKPEYYSVETILFREFVERGDYGNAFISLVRCCNLQNIDINECVTYKETNLELIDLMDVFIDSIVFGEGADKVVICQMQHKLYELADKEGVELKYLVSKLV